MHIQPPVPLSAGRRRILAACLALPLVAAGCTGMGAEADRPGTRTLSGNVVYRERMALPPGAVVKVALLDVSLADAPARVIAQTEVSTEGRSTPFPYTLNYEASAIDPRMRYALQARIERGGELLFINTTHHAAFGPDASTDILVQRVSTSAPGPAAA